MSDKRLLILDDDPLIGQTICFIADTMGMESQATDKPTDFFAALDSWQPTHIALDLVMPEMDGVEVMVELARRSCRAKIIITSGVGSRVLDAAGRSAAEHKLMILGVLAKPFLPSALRKLLQSESKTPSNDLPESIPMASSAASRAVVNQDSLQEALDKHELFLVYQPKISCKNGKPVGFEALVRWYHPEVGIISPGDFIPVAELSGLIDQLTDRVIDLALNFFAEGFNHNEMHISINISAKNLKNLAFADRVAELCQNLNVPSTSLLFELTETTTMEDPVISLDLLTRLRLKGFQLSIDDFCTGFSSMLQLVRLPFSEIKVDRSFVMTASTSQESRTVIKSIIELGHSLGLRTTAEGVEDEEALAYLRTVGCDLAQGFAIARPMSSEAARNWYFEQRLQYVSSMYTR